MIVTVNYSLYDYNLGTKRSHPRDLTPCGAKLKKWESHPIMDAISVIYEFTDKSKFTQFVDCKEYPYDKCTIKELEE